MSTQAPAETKYCCKCSKDVTHAQRMKDTDGKYWCPECAKKDEAKKQEHAGATCKGCHEAFSKPQLTWVGGVPYCKPCMTARFAVKKSFLGRVWSQIRGG